MKKNYIFDNILKTEIKENIEEISTDRDLFEEAWAKKEDYERKYERRNYYMKRVKLAAFALGACISLGGLCFGVSPTVRAAVSTFFGMDDNGNIIEETEDDTGYVNSSINLDDSNKAVIEELLGYKIVYRERVGNYIMSDKNGMAGISVKDVKGKDMDKVDELIRNATDYKALNEELSKDYSVYFNAAGLYINTVNDDKPI